MISFLLVLLKHETVLFWYLLIEPCTLTPLLDIIISEVESLCIVRIMSTNRTFSPEVDFCPVCGALLPSLTARGDVTCMVCKFVVSSKLFDEKVFFYFLILWRVTCVIYFLDNSVYCPLQQPGEHYQEEEVWSWRCWWSSNRKKMS